MPSCTVRELLKTEHARSGTKMILHAGLTRYINLLKAVGLYFYITDAKASGIIGHLGFHEFPHHLTVQ